MILVMSQWYNSSNETCSWQWLLFTDDLTLGCWKSI